MNPTIILSNRKNYAGLRHVAKLQLRIKGAKFDTFTRVPLMTRDEVIQELEQRLQNDGNRMAVRQARHDNMKRNAARRG